MFTVKVWFWQRSLSGCLLLCFLKQSPEWLCPLCVHRSIHLPASHSTQRSKHRRIWTHNKKKKQIKKKTEVACFVSCRASSVLLSHREKGGNKAASKVCVCALLHWSPRVQQWDRVGGAGQLWFAGGWAEFLARRPVVAHAQLGPGDGHLVHTGGAHLWREMDDAAVVLHILKFVLLGGLHVDNGILVYMLL